MAWLKVSLPPECTLVEVAVPSVLACLTATLFEKRGSLTFFAEAFLGDDFFIDSELVSSTNQAFSGELRARQLRSLSRARP
jgi:hypothetical protein